jgi:preprotein translocase subunit YajC
VTQIFPLLLLTLVLVAMMAFSRRNKQRAAAADAVRRERITTGTDVMTTSGLYGTVVSVNDDGTVLLSIAPGVEVRWTIAALREVSELPDQYREPIAGVQPGSVAGVQPGSGPGDQPGSAAGSSATELPSSAAARAASPNSRRPRRRGAGPS